jgi:hypothetical protein
LNRGNRPHESTTWLARPGDDRRCRLAAIACRHPRQPQGSTAILQGKRQACRFNRTRWRKCAIRNPNSQEWAWDGVEKEGTYRGSDAGGEIRGGIESGTQETEAGSPPPARFGERGGRSSELVGAWTRGDATKPRRRWRARKGIDRAREQDGKSASFFFDLGCGSWTFGERAVSTF